MREPAAIVCSQRARDHTARRHRQGAQPQLGLTGLRQRPWRRRALCAWQRLERHGAQREQRKRDRQPRPMAHTHAGLSAQLGRLDCGSAPHFSYLPEHETADDGVCRADRPAWTACWPSAANVLPLGRTTKFGPCSARVRFLMRRLGKTPPFRGPRGEVVPGSIAEIAYLRLGGVDQWVMIRGESVANPPLIFLHGGPGLSETGFFRHFNAPLEKSFTVVYWDQRGAGKSFDRDIPRSSMTVEQFIADLDELVDAVRKRLGKTKVAIFGHSWGSALGVLYAARFPEKVAAYVGSGQIGDWAAGESASYAFALAEAQRRGNAQGGEEAARDRPAAAHRRAACGRSAPGCRGSRAAWARGPCGSWDEPCSAGRNPRSSICPAPCAASGSRSTRCGPKSRA